MTSVFDPIETAIVSKYLGHSLPEGVSEHDLYNICTDQEDHEPSLPVRLREGNYALENAVARLCLNAIADRLPQWALVHEGHVTLGRKPQLRRPRRVEALPWHLLTINWADSAPGYSWPEAYYATYLPEFDVQVVTASVDSEDVYGCCDLAIGHFEATRPLQEGVHEVLVNWWHKGGDDPDFRWAYLFDEGYVSREEAYAWREEVWPTPRFDDLEEEDAWSMAIPVRFLTVIMRKGDLERHYPGGLAGFRQGRGSLLEDEYLVGITFMSSGEAQIQLDVLCALGFPPGQIAVFEWVHGLLQPADWIEVGCVEGHACCWLAGHRPVEAGAFRPLFDADAD